MNTYVYKDSFDIFVESIKVSDRNDIMNLIIKLSKTPGVRIGTGEPDVFKYIERQKANGQIDIFQVDGSKSLYFSHVILFHSDGTISTMEMIDFNRDYTLYSFNDLSVCTPDEIRNAYAKLVQSTIDYHNDKFRLREAMNLEGVHENGFIGGSIKLSSADPLCNIQAPEAPTALQKQVGGSHYKNFATQPVEFITANNLGYIEGNVIKYICRHQYKNGRQDLEKAIHYIEMLMDLKYPLHPEAEGE